jgi:hypothetical protein
LPAGWSWLRRVGLMLGLGLVFLIVITPFAVNYLRYYQHGAPGNFDQIWAILAAHFSVEIPQKLGEFLGILWSQGLLVWGLAGFGLAWLFCKQDRPALRLALVWLGGILLVSGLVPLVEYQVEKAFYLLPFETELVRGVRYSVPILLVFGLWPLARLNLRWPQRSVKVGAAVAGLLLVSGWVAIHPPQINALSQSLQCFGEGQLVCSPERMVDMFLVAVQKTPRGACIFPFAQSSESSAPMQIIRYTGLRPITFSNQDTGLLGYANPAALLRWNEISNEINRLSDQKDPTVLLSGAIHLAKVTGASYLALDYAPDLALLASQPVTLLYRSRDYSLLDLHSPVLCGDPNLPIH